MAQGTLGRRPPGKTDPRDDGPRDDGPRDDGAGEDGAGEDGPRAYSPGEDGGPAAGRTLARRGSALM
jgi:hypothetical protein